MLTSGKGDRPLGVQLLGCEENFILKALDVLKGHNFDILDFNSACPAKKVIRRGEGCSLMREPKKLAQILKLIVKNSSWPVTVKIRSGWDKGSVNARDVALSAQDCGVSAVFIHGRTKIQGYSGSVDYSVIRKVKEALKIPVIASGDVLSAQLAKKMFDETGCDGLSVARGSLGNPWIFKQIKEFLDKGKAPVSPAISIVVKIMIKHLNASVNFYGEKNGVVIFRKFFSWYTRGFRKVRPLREKSSRAKTLQDMLSIFGDALQGARPHSE